LQNHVQTHELIIKQGIQAICIEKIIIYVRIVLKIKHKIKAFTDMLCLRILMSKIVTLNLPSQQQIHQMQPERGRLHHAAVAVAVAVAVAMQPLSQALALNLTLTPLLAKPPKTT
jgi:hypothetical protein